MDEPPLPPSPLPDPATGAQPVPRGRSRLAALAAWARRGRVMAASAIVLAVALGVLGYVEVVLLGAQYGRSPGGGIITNQSPTIATWGHTPLPWPDWTIVMPMERTQHGPLWDTTRWELAFTHKGVAVASPDVAARADALEVVRRGLPLTRTPSSASVGLDEELEVAQAMLLAGELVRVDVDGRLRSWNIAWHAALAVAVLLAAHLLAALLLAALLWAHARRTGGAQVPRAMTGPLLSVLVALSVLPPLAWALWLAGPRWIDPAWPAWPLAAAPLAVPGLVAVAAVLLGTARMRRARAMGYAACEGCLYDLRGLAERGSCPECGRAYERERTVAMWKGALG